MKKITRFSYRSNGTVYRGCLDGHLTHSQIQMALLSRRCGCANIWAIEHQTVAV